MALVSTTLAQVIPPWGCFHITITAKSMSHNAKQDQNYNNITYMYILKSQSQHNHNQEKERLCCSLLTLLRQLVGNPCPTGNGMTMNIIVKAHTCNLSYVLHQHDPPKNWKLPSLANNWESRMFNSCILNKSSAFLQEHNKLISIISLKCNVINEVNMIVGVLKSSPRKKKN